MALRRQVERRVFVKSLRYLARRPAEAGREAAAWPRPAGATGAASAGARGRRDAFDCCEARQQAAAAQKQSGQLECTSASVRGRFPALMVHAAWGLCRKGKMHSIIFSAFLSLSGRCFRVWAPPRKRRYFVVCCSVFCKGQLSHNASYLAHFSARPGA